MQTLTERRDAYNMQVSQDWKTFRWSRITLLSDPAGKLIRTKVHVFSDSTLCVGVSNPDPTIGLHKWRKYGTNTDLTTEIQFVWHVLPGASTIDTNKLVQSRLNGLDPQLFEERIVFLSMFNDIDWTIKVKTEICLHNAKGVAAFASTLGHWGLRQKRRGGTEIRTNPKNNGTVEQHKWWTFSCVHHRDSTIIGWDN